MKKLLTLLVCALISISAYAQKIVSDDTPSDGNRYIFCSKENVGGFSDRIKLFIGLSYMQPVEGNPLYSLCIRLNCGEVTTIHKGGRMLLKTFDGDIVELSTYTGGSDEMKSISGVNIWEVSAQYSITPEQLALLEKGITKIRIELGDSKTYDKEWKKDKVGKILAKESALIQNAIKTDSKASFSEGF